jgi:hypothetical protein
MKDLAMSYKAILALGLFAVLICILQNSGSLASFFGEKSNISEDANGNACRPPPTRHPLI